MRMKQYNKNKSIHKNRTFFMLIIIIFYLVINAFSQVTEKWVARYNGPGNDEDSANAIAIDSSGNVYITGNSIGSGTYEDYATIKYNSLGIQQWVARYNGPGNDEDLANAIAVDSSGNVYVTGKSIGSGTYEDFATIKYNSSGVQQWIARYNGPGNGDDYAMAIALDNSGNVYVTGMSYSSETHEDYATIKYNNSGVQQWVAKYNGPRNGGDYANVIAVDNSGNAYVTGGSDGSGTGGGYATINYDSSGIEQWVARYDNPENTGNYARAIALDSVGNVYITGSMYVYVTGVGTIFDYATVKYNSTGVGQWAATYNGPKNGWDDAQAIVLDSLGNVYVTGGSEGSETNRDYATIKYNNVGVEQWVARYNGPGNDMDYAFAMAIDNSRSVYVTGGSEGSGTDRDYATIKYDSSGVEQWIARYNGQGNYRDHAEAITVDSLGNVYVTGESDGSGTDSDYVTIKYSQGAFSDNFYLY